VRNCVRSIRAGYLHFNRVRSYQGLRTPARHDGEQLPGDRAGKAGSTFARRRVGSRAANYYDRSPSPPPHRCENIAFCVAIEDTITSGTYGGRHASGQRGWVRLRQPPRPTLNRKWKSGAAALAFDGITVPPDHSDRKLYGIVERDGRVHSRQRDRGPTDMYT